ncbi:MAG: ECF-type sigma factor [Phycisphaerales bacterium]|nr:hypothetical protein [Planctomycetota bacterium]
MEQNANHPPDHVRTAPSPEGSVTRLVNRIGAGELASHDAMVPAVYEVLKQIARQRAAESNLGWRPTELVHEAFLKLFGRGPVAFESRAHFYGSAARAMQQLLINTAKSAHHRYTVDMPPEGLAAASNEEPLDGVPGGDGVPRVDRSGSLDVSLVASAIEELAEQDGPLAELARLRIFAGLSTIEVARTLNISEHRAEREWTLAKAWISRKVRGG